MPGGPELRTVDAGPSGWPCLVQSDPLRVVIAMEHADIDLRRAGLDRNPGFLPWLGQKVEIVFEADEAY